MRRADRNFRIQIAAVVIVLAALFGAVIYEETQPMQAQDLAIRVADLRSLCAAGAHLNDRYVAGDLTRKFFENQMELMSESVISLRDELDSADAEPVLSEHLHHAREMAEKADIAFYGLTRNEHEQNAAAVLGDLREPLKKLEDDLKQEAEK